MAAIKDKMEVEYPNIRFASTAVLKKIIKLLRELNIVMHDKVMIGKAPIASLSLVDLMQCLWERIVSRQKGYVCFCEAHLCVRATFDQEIGKILEDAFLVLPDAVAMTLGAKILRNSYCD